MKGLCPTMILSTREVSSPRRDLARFPGWNGGAAAQANVPDFVPSCMVKSQAGDGNGGEGQAGQEGPPSIGHERHCREREHSRGAVGVAVVAGNDDRYEARRKHGRRPPRMEVAPVLLRERVNEPEPEHVGGERQQLEGDAEWHDGVVRDPDRRSAP